MESMPAQCALRRAGLALGSAAILAVRLRPDTISREKENRAGTRRG